MSAEVFGIVVALFLFLQGLAVQYIQTRLKKSIGHKFNVKLKEIEQAFNREMAEKEREDRFQLATISERIKAHQEAFSLIAEIQTVVWSKKKNYGKVLVQIIDFTNKRCLYLAKNSREAFLPLTGEFVIYMLVEAINENPNQEVLCKLTEYDLIREKLSKNRDTRLLEFSSQLTNLQHELTKEIDTNSNPED